MAEVECDELEMEIDEDAIVAYLFDEDDNEIGFTMLDEDGNEVEYYYVEEDEPTSTAASHEPASFRDPDAEIDFGITREGVAEATNDANVIYREGVQTAAELKSAFDDIMAGLDFSDLLGKGKK